MSAPASLFSDDLISPEVQSSLPEGYIARPLQRTDFQHGHLDVLRDLAVVGDITEEAWVERYDWMASCHGSYYVLVFVDTKAEPSKQIVATGTLIVERKFLFKLGLQGHIEDIAVAKGQQGKKFGVKLLSALDFVADKVGCYKNILDCSPENTGFYVKCSYEQAGQEMHRYFDAEAEKVGV
ncbi:acyl-CoA N-acyltransferase [Microthyrium microscopicum]|uniref:Glucosamine 6-phosphate N-acetyltransferase n=1 Tax=Microthyrium microscopicum TaxID=703497 RepID=A0A6A6UJ54_9PEZI|nr:acyl-CoA N-acyltransferase [Microthyrium microscopicum]